jgi:hypothetical protein
MSEKVIKAIKHLGSFEMKDGKTLHRQGIVFEDDTKGVAFSNDSVPPYKAGQSVFVTPKGTTDKTTGAPNVKIDKQAPQGGGGYSRQSSGGSSSQSSGGGGGNIGIEVGQALNKAIDCVIATSKDGINMDTFYADVLSYAKTIYLVGQELRGNPPSGSTQSANSADNKSDVDEEVQF